MLNTWLSIFLQVQDEIGELQDLGAEFGTERMKWAGDDEERDRIVYQTSRKYRSVLLSLLQAEEGRNPHGVSQHQSDESRLLQYVNSAWSLVELLYFDRASNITRQLRHWLQETCPSPCTDVSLSDKSFWPTVRRVTVQGRFEATSKMLESIKLERPELLERVEGVRVLLSRNNINEKVQRPMEEVRAFQREWRQECLKLASDLNREDSETASELVKVLQIMVGDKKALLDASESWYELVVAQLLFVRPHKASKWLTAELVAAAVREPKFSGQPQERKLDAILVDVFTGKIFVAMSKMNSSFGAPWLSAHLVDLLAHSGNLVDREGLDADGEGDDGLDRSTVREMLILEYASSIMNHPSMWQVAAEYLSVCPNHGAVHLAELVASVPVTSNTVLLKLASICDKYGLTDQKHRLFVQRGLTAARAHQYGLAAEMFIEAGDRDLVASLCGHALAFYLTTKSSDRMHQIVDSAGSNSTFCKELLFLTNFLRACRLQRHARAMLMRLMRATASSAQDTSMKQLWEEGQGEEDEESGCHLLKGHELADLCGELNLGAVDSESSLLPWLQCRETLGKCVAQFSELVWQAPQRFKLRLLYRSCRLLELLRLLDGKMQELGPKQPGPPAAISRPSPYPHLQEVRPPAWTPSYQSPSYLPRPRLPVKTTHLLMASLEDSLISVDSALHLKLLAAKGVAEQQDRIKFIRGALLRCLCSL